MNIPRAVKQSGIGDGLRRLFNARSEQRTETESQTAILNHRGRRHVVRVANISASGAMIVYAGDLAAGDEVVLHLLDQGPVRAQARWVRDGRVGVSFDGPSGQKLGD